MGREAYAVGQPLSCGPTAWRSIFGLAVRCFEAMNRQAHVIPDCRLGRLGVYYLNLRLGALRAVHYTAGLKGLTLLDFLLRYPFPASAAVINYPCLFLVSVTSQAHP